MVSSLQAGVAWVWFDIEQVGTVETGAAAYASAVRTGPGYPVEFGSTVGRTKSRNVY